MSNGTERMRTLRLALLAAAAATAVLAAGCSSGSTESTTTAQAPATTTAEGGAAASDTPTGTQSAAVTITADDMKFSPDAVTISTGDTVTWKFADDVPHAVQGIGDSAMGINSPIFTSGEWSHTFTMPGTYRYLCPLHPEMRGTVTVE